MAPINIIFGTTNSLPPGLGNETIEDLYQQCYRPFIKLLYQATEIKATLHYSGYLLEWLERHHSEFIDALHDMTKRNQIELLGGGFYEPILALLPRSDCTGQIERNTTMLRRLFGKRPRGLWLTSLTWEASYPSLLYTNDIEYTFLHDDLFREIGLRGADLWRPCITEHVGRTLIVFPLHQTAVWNRKRDYDTEISTLSRSLKSTSNSASVATIINRGDLFPGTAVCQRLFDTLRQHASTAPTTLPGDYLKRHNPLRRAYFGSCYPVASKKRFGGIMRRHKPPLLLNTHLSHYPECHLLYSKMHYVHALINHIRRDKTRRKMAHELVWLGQSHWGYWNADPVGIYHSGLRKAIYSSLIDAEKMTREDGLFISSVIAVDFDMDGFDEYLYRGRYINAYVHTRAGALFELDYLPTAWNWLDTMARYPEPYHGRMARRNGYDRYPRHAFIDHFFDTTTSLLNFKQMKYRDGAPFYRSIYLIEDYGRKSLRLRSEQPICPKGHRLGLEKHYTFSDSSVTVEYTLRNLSQHDIEGIFATEINCSPTTDPQRELTMRCVDGSGMVRETQGEPIQIASCHEDITVVELRTKSLHTNAILEVSPPAEVWTLPIETIGSRSDRESVTYQGLCLVPRWKLELKPGETMPIQVTLSVVRKRAAK